MPPALGALPPSKPIPTDRPPLPPRQSSYSKRHASFDTPREIPLPSGFNTGFEDGRGDYFEMARETLRAEVERDWEREKEKTGNTTSRTPGARPKIGRARPSSPTLSSSLLQSQDRRHVSSPIQSISPIPSASPSPAPRPNPTPLPQSQSTRSLDEESAGSTSSLPLPNNQPLKSFPLPSPPDDDAASLPPFDTDPVATLPQVQQGEGSGSDSPRLRLPPPLHLSLPRSVSYQSQASSTLSPSSPPLFEDEEVDGDDHGEQSRKRGGMADGHRNPGVGMPSDSMSPISTTKAKLEGQPTTSSTPQTQVKFPLLGRFEKYAQSLQKSKLASVAPSAPAEPLQPTKRAVTGVGPRVVLPKDRSSLPASASAMHTRFLDTTTIAQRSSLPLMSGPLSKSAVKRAPTPPPPSPPHIFEAEIDDEATAVTSGRKPRVGSPSKLATPPPTSPRVPNSNVHERFLAAPSRSLNPSVSVNTLKESYEIAVRFEEIGMRRDGITLSTRRRRVLHIQADDYGATGGHWERRIGFGWDADLKNVRAEFDGAMLRVLVPRKKGSGIEGTVGGAASHL